MLATHNHRTGVRAKRQFDVPTQVACSRPNSPTHALLSVGLALIEASEHVLATARAVLGSLPEPERLVASVPLPAPPDGPTETVVVNERPWVVVDSQRLGPVCEAIVESEW